MLLCLERNSFVTATQELSEIRKTSFNGKERRTQNVQAFFFNKLELKFTFRPVISKHNG
jgi:hypothetical protein